MPFLQEDVLGLDVPVHDPLRVRMAERVGDLPRDAHGLVERELLLALEPVAEGLAGDERHHIVEHAPGLAAVEEREDVRMLQLGRRLDLGQETLGAERGGEIGVHDLDRDLPVVAEVVREMHRRHPALADLPLKAVAVGEGGGEGGEGLRCRGAHEC